MIALTIRINESKIVPRLVQEERKSVWGFGGAGIKDWETKSMLTLCHRHRKKFIHWSKIAKEVTMDRKRCVSLQRPDKI